MKRRVLTASIFFVSACALVYELALGTLASFTLGDAIAEYSVTLGLYLFSMGVGAWASKRIVGDATFAYVLAELLLALAGGFSVPIVMHVNSGSAALRPVLYAFIMLVGGFVGVELPLLLRLRKEEATARAGSFDESVSTSLALDYGGALLASCIFPFVLVPWLGLFRTTLVTGAANATLALAMAISFPMKHKKSGIVMIAFSGVVSLALIALAIGSDALSLVPKE